ncbi:MAG TPA: RDD family protein [Xanthobacteraceae bacterium]
MTLVHERTSQFFEGVRRRRREIITPEGVPIPVELADYGERLSAFFIDWVIWTVATIAIYLPIILSIGKAGSVLLAISVALFLGFIIRNMYFVFFEIAWRGATPGKRAVGLRVIDRHGGPLLPSAVIARNLTREVEMFLPLGVLMAGGRSATGAVDWEELSLALWMLFFAVLPAINRDRMRGGDMIAGTMVIALPKRALSSDLVEAVVQFAFTEQHLRAYGAFELQVLEELLRRPHSPDTMRVLNDVCDKICRRIGWTAPLPPHQVELFLRDFYTAERAFLEREQLYGKGRADKYAQPGAG